MQLYATEFKQPRQYIHVQPFSNQDIPDYDMDSEDIKFFEEELKNKLKFEVTQLCFENMIDRLEKNSTTNAVTIKEAKHILKEDDDLILLVYDYWLNKRLTNQQGLVPSVKSVNVSQGHNPYVCFRRRTEKMQTRKNRKNEEASYESMLKLRRDLTKVVTLLEMVKRREKTKKEKLNLTIDILDKRYSMKDFDGKLMDSAIASSSRYKFNNSINIQNWISISSPPQRKTYKSKRKHLKNGHRFFGDTYKTSNNIRVISPNNDKLVSSEDESLNGDDPMESNPFTFIRKEGVQYRAPLDDIDLNDEETDNISSEPFMLTGLSTQSGTTRCIGYCRRRLGRGGRVVIDRISTKWDDRWTGDGGDVDCQDPWMVRPLTPPHVEDMDWDPYMVRNQEEVSLSRVEAVEAGRMNNNNKMFKIVDMNKSLAHNAAGAIVDSQFVGKIFKIYEKK